MVRHRASWAVLVVMLASSSVARAQDAPPAADSADVGSDAEARGLFSAGEAAYGAGRFEDALGYFRRAYELSRRPQLLYNIGVAASNAGHDREALDAFERYVAEVPDAPNRASVEGRITALRRQLEEADDAARRLAEAEAEARARATETEERRRADSAGAESLGAAGIALTITGGALLAGGVVMFAIGMVDVAAVEGAADGTPWVELDAANDRAPILTGVGIAAGATGLAALGVGIALLAIGGSSSSDAPTVRVGPSGLDVRGTF